MCQISLINTGDDYLNRKLFLITGSLGSAEHSDGWGFSNSSGEAWKCPLPMFLTSDAGIILRNTDDETNRPFLGHIRKASPKVKVCTENSHPFVEQDIIFVHNGKLNPKDESKFVLEYEETTTDKDGKEKKVTYSVSDSELFLKEFVKIYNEKHTSGLRDDNLFVESVKATMDLFYGKFAFVFLINGVYYVVKGKSANLFVSVIREEDKKDTKPLGWVINTSKEVLDASCLLLSNLEQFQGNHPVYSSPPVEIPSEKIFRADPLSLVEIGEIKENYAPVKVYTTTHYSGNDTNFTAGVYGKTILEKDVEKLSKEIVQFMLDYSLRPLDIQIMFSVIYTEVSTLEVTEGILRHFVKKVIPLVRNLSNKDNRKAVKNASGGFSISPYKYDGYQYPWMLNPKNIQAAFAKKLNIAKK